MLHISYFELQHFFSNNYFSLLFQIIYVPEGDTLAGISVYVSETPDWRTGTLCYQHDIEQPLNNTVNIDCFTSGRYVTLFNSRNETYFPDLSAFAYINICEMHIAGSQLFILSGFCIEVYPFQLNDSKNVFVYL